MLSSLWLLLPIFINRNKTSPKLSLCHEMLPMYWDVLIIEMRKRRISAPRNRRSCCCCYVIMLIKNPWMHRNICCSVMRSSTNRPWIRWEKNARNHVTFLDIWWWRTKHGKTFRRNENVNESGWTHEWNNELWMNKWNMNEQTNYEWTNELLGNQLKSLQVEFPGHEWLEKKLPSMMKTNVYGWQQALAALDVVVQQQQQQRQSL